MHALFASAVLAFATTAQPAAAPPTETAQTAAASAPLRADTPRRQRRHDRIAMATPAGSTYDDALARQADLHVQMPVLTGDGGG